MKPFKLVVRAYSSDEYGDSPSWAEVTVTHDLVQTLERLRRVCKSGSLMSVTAPIPPDRWDHEGDLSICGGSLSVSGDYFYYEGYLRHDDYNAQTIPCSIDSLRRIARKISEDDTENPLPYGFYMSRGVVFYDDPDLAELYYDESQE